MSTQIKGTTSGLNADVDANNQLKVALPITAANAGIMAMGSVADDGLVTGAANRLVREIDSTPDYRLRMGQDNFEFQEYFPGTVINTSRWAVPIATSTISQAGGFITLNSAATPDKTAAHGCILRSNMTFPIFATFPRYADFLLNLLYANFNNAQAEFGQGIIGITPGTGPQDGAYFRISPSGISCVLCNNGVEVSETFISTANIPNFSIINTNHFQVLLDDDRAIFKINNYLVNITVRPVSGATCSAAQQVLLFARQINTGTNTLNGMVVNIAMIATGILDGIIDLPYSHRICSSGEALFQNYTGLAVGKTAVFNNQTTEPAQMTALSSVALGTNGVTGLGGRQRVGTALTFTADNAYIMFSYQTPDLVIAAPIFQAKTLMLTGIKISSMTRGAAGAANIGTFIWSLWVGCRNVNPATAENGATPVKLARPIDLGMQTLITSAPVGTLFTPDIQIMFNDGPIPWYPGEYFQAAITPLVTYVQQTSQEFVFTLTPIGYWK